jgi:hypothetical protein
MLRSCLKKKIKQLVFFLSFLLISFNLNAIENQKIKEISEDKLNQLNSLLNNQFFDPRRNQYTKIFQLMYYALSNDGNFSSISICDTDPISDYDCIDNFEKFMTIKNCEKISQQTCSIIINKNKLLLNEKIYFLTRENNQILKYFNKEKIKISKKIANKKNSTKVIFTGLQSRDLDD